MMKVEQFCTLLKEKLNEEHPVEAGTKFKELESYSSLTSIIILQFLEEDFDTKINPRSFRNLNTVEDLLEAVGREKFN